MKRIFLTAVASSALALALGAPGAALAHDGEQHQGEHQLGEHHHHHHHARDARTQRRHHRHAHFMRFGPQPAGAPAPPAAPMAPANETAGTVASFTNGVLTIKLIDGSMVAGKVTEGTRIECRSAASNAITADDHGENRGEDGADNSGPGGNSGPGNAGRGDEGQDNDRQDNDAQDNDRQDNDGRDDDANDEAEHCTTAALVPGAVVREAELRVSSSGAVWQEVELGQ
jgi:hypothetical protein